MVSRILKITGLLGITLTLFILGYVIGRTPTTREDNIKAEDQVYKADLYSLSDNYGRLYSLCEQKYQVALSGDYSTATRINGQMDILLGQINQIMKKYEIKSL